MTATFLLKTRGYDENGHPDPWQWIEFPTQRTRDRASEIYVRIGGLETETVDIYRESEVVR